MKFSSEHTFSFSSFENLSPQQVQAMLELRSRVFVMEQQCIYLDPDEEDQKAIHVMVDLHGELAAYARLYLADEWHVGRIIVSEEHRGSGLGKALVEKCIHYWQEQEERKPLTMSAQVYLSDFYSACGFEIEGSMYLEDGIPHLRMVYQPLP